eukprot:gene576-466_t
MVIVVMLFRFLILQICIGRNVCSATDANIDINDRAQADSSGNAYHDSNGQDQKESGGYTDQQHAEGKQSHNQEYDQQQPHVVAMSP